MIDRKDDWSKRGDILYSNNFYISKENTKDGMEEDFDGKVQNFSHFRQEHVGSTNNTRRGDMPRLDKGKDMKEDFDRTKKECFG
jgi:hypothetical protein